MTPAKPDHPAVHGIVASPEAHAIERVRRHRRGASAGGGGVQLNLTAMIDVVFLLLVYFMVATEFKVGEEIYRLDLPERQQAQRELDPFDLDEEPLRIDVASTEFGRLRYRLAVEGPYPQPEDFEELYRFLEDRQINEYTTGGLFEPDHPIIIEPTRTTTWAHSVEAFNAAARARYTNIVFASPR